MKNLIKIFSLAAIIGFFVASCNTDPCKDVVCGTNGSCLEGVCNCETGYEQDTAGLCNRQIRAKFLGQWTATDVCTPNGSGNVIMSVTATTNNIFNVDISNFWGVFSMPVSATASGNNITISRQEPDNDNYFVQGNGVLGTNGNIAFNYTITQEDSTGTVINTVTCTSTWIK